MRAPGNYREAIARVEQMALGDRVTVAYDRLQLMRTAGNERGVRLTLIEKRTDGLAVVQRVAETRWGKVKARVCALAIGDAITAPMLKKESYCASARSMGMHLRADKVTDHIVLLTRIEQSPRHDYGSIKQFVAGLAVGAVVQAENARRAVTLCSTGYNLGLGMTRRRNLDGTYTVTRTA